MRERRPRVKAARIEFSTAFAKMKNPNWEYNVVSYVPDTKATEVRRVAVQDAAKRAKFDDKWEQIKAAAKLL